jgi:hypothetical protein
MSKTVSTIFCFRIFLDSYDCLKSKSRINPISFSDELGGVGETLNFLDAHAPRRWGGRNIGADGEIERLG